MKYLKKFNESIEFEGFELSSHEERNNSRNLFNSLSFTDEEYEEVDIVLNSYGFKEMTTRPSFYKGQTYLKSKVFEMEIYLDKYEDDWYYVLYYEHYNANAIIYKCSEFEGLINALHYIGKNYG